MIKLDLKSSETYLESCRKIARADFAGLSVAEVAAAEDDYNAYPGLENLTPPQNQIFLEDRLNDTLRQEAREAILDGRVFWEHAAAGEATRLKLGPKYLIHPHNLHLSHDYLASGLVEPAQVGGDDGLAGLRPAAHKPFNPQKLLPLPLGARHLWQWVFEIIRLAEASGVDPEQALARQRTLLVINDLTRETILRRIARVDFLGLAPENFLFLVQPAFPGLTPGPEGWDFDPDTESRLHNHGQMAMQKTMDGQVFRLDRQGREHHLSREEFFSLLGQADDLVSYNIEDLDFLTRALDFDTIGLALALGREGYGMTMEVVANNPEHPIKGGLCAHDPALSRDVMVESFRLRDLPPERITHLNKNFNHYPRPAEVFGRLHQEGIFMPVTVKNNALYFQPVQGDLNFLARTAFITRRTPAPLRSWKSQGDTPAAVEAMARQDAQPGFSQLVHNHLGKG